MNEAESDREGFLNKMGLLQEVRHLKELLSEKERATDKALEMQARFYERQILELNKKCDELEIRTDERVSALENWRSSWGGTIIALTILGSGLSILALLIAFTKK